MADTLASLVQLSAANTALVLDSTADLPAAAERHAGWRTVSAYVTFGDESLRDYLDLSPADFYSRLRSSPAQPRTSQPSPGDFEAAFADLASYERIVCVVLSEKLSQTGESARLAAGTVGPDRVLVVDSGVISGGTVLLADAIQRRLERGTTEDEVAALADRYRREAIFLFTVDTLEYLVRGGRVGRAAGLAGQLLDTKPILAIEAGEVVPRARVRGRRKALAALERLFLEGTRDHADLHVAVSHAEAAEEAARLADTIREVRPRAGLDLVTTFGPVIGTHAGPGAVALAWFDDRSG